MPTTTEKGLLIHTYEETQTAFRLHKEIDEDKRQWPPEIIAKRQQIETATRNAEQFWATSGYIDQEMVAAIVKMKLELDALYSAWLVRETS